MTRGHRDHQLRHKRWEIPAEHKGKTVQVEAFDRGSEEWDHILVDNICQYEKLTPDPRPEPAPSPDAGAPANTPDAGSPTP